MSGPSTNPDENEGQEQAAVISPSVQGTTHETRESIITADSIVDALQLIDIDITQIDTLSRPVYDFLSEMDIYDVMDILDMANVSYSGYKTAIGDNLFFAVVQTIVDIKMLGTYIFTRNNFAEVVTQHEGDVEAAWQSFYSDDVHRAYHKRHFHRYKLLERAIETASLPDEVKISRKSNVSFATPTTSNVTPKRPTLRTSTVTETPISNIDQNTEQLHAEARYQEAMSALNESFLKKAPVEPPKLLSRKELHNKITWDGNTNTFGAFKCKYESYLLQSEQAYVRKSTFREAYLEGGDALKEQCLAIGISVQQVKKDTIHQYGSLLQACSSSPSTQRFFSKRTDDGIYVWHQMLEWYDGNVTSVIMKVQASLSKEYHDKFPGGVVGFLTHIANAYARQEQLVREHPDCEQTLPSDAMKITHLMMQFQHSNQGSVIYNLHATRTNKNETFEEFLERIRNRYDYVEDGHMLNAKKNARTAQQEIITATPSPLEQSMPFMAHISRTDPRYMQPALYQLMQRMDSAFARRFLSERDKLPISNEKAKPSAERVNDEKPKPLPKQYTNDKNKDDPGKVIKAAVASSERENHTDEVDKELEVLQSMYMDWYGPSGSSSTDDRHADTTITVRNIDEATLPPFHNTTANHFITISDCGADTWIVGKGWRVLATTNRSANVIGFDSEQARKRNLPIVAAAAVVKDETGQECLLVVFECVHNDSSKFSLMSEFQTRAQGNIIDSVAADHIHWNGEAGHQAMRLTSPIDSPDKTPTEPIISFTVNQALMVFQHRYPTDDDLTTLPRYQMTSNKGIWMPQNFMTTSSPIITPCNDNAQIIYTAVQEFISFQEPSTSVITQRSVEGGGSIAITNDYGILDSGGDNTSMSHWSACLSSLPDQCAHTTKPPMSEIHVYHERFYDAEPCDEPYLFDPTDEDTNNSNEHDTPTASIDLWLSTLDNDELFGMEEPFDTFAFGVRAAIHNKQAASLQPYLGFRPLEVIRRTIECTTQLGATVNYHHLRAHLKSLLPWANKTRLEETVSTDTIFSDTRDVSSSVCAQVFYGLRSHMINVYGMRTESEGPTILDDFIRAEGIPSIMRSDNARMQRYGKSWLQRLRELLIHAEFSEPHNQQQNPVELRAIRWLKDSNKVLTRRTGAPREVWLEALQYLADIHNVTADETLGWRTPSAMRHGTQPDISQFLQFQFWEPVIYLDSEQKFPSTKERKGRWIGIAPNVGDFFCWKIYDEETEQIVERSVVQSRWKNIGMPKEPIVYDDDECNDAFFAAKPIPIRHDQARKERVKEKRIQRKAEQKARKEKRRMKVIPEVEPITVTQEELMAESTIDQAVRLLHDREQSPITTLVDELHEPNEHHDPINTLQTHVEEVPDVSVANLSMPSPKPRHDPIQPKPMNEEVPIAVRRSQRNITKPSRFRAMLAMNATLMMIPIIPIASILMNTHSIIPVRLSQESQFPWFDNDIIPAKYNVVQGEYVRMCDKVADAEDTDHDVWKPIQMLGHSVRKRKTKERIILAKVRWKDDDISWLPLNALRVEEPFLVISYVKDNPNLIKSPDFKWIQDVVKDTPRIVSMARAFQARMEREPRIKFGVKVPYSIAQALQFDEENGNHLWSDAVNTELTQIHDYETFRLPNENDNLEEYTRIPYHFVFDVKFDGRRKARLVAGGNHTEPTKESVFSGVVNISSVRLGFLLASLNGLQVCAADIGNAFLYGRTKEKVYIRAGQEFGPLCGKLLIIHKGLYGLRTSSARFHEHLSTKLKLLGYAPSKADADLWIKDVGTHYEYIARYVDDIIAFGKDPLTTINDIKKVYVLKGIGSPEYYLGGDVIELDSTWHRHGIHTALSAHTYATNVVKKYETLLKHDFRKYNSPMEKEYHPETDESDFLSAKDITLYRGLIGSANWMITLGRFDIAYATNSMARFNAKPREGHLRAMYRLFGYIKHCTKGQILVDSNYMDWSQYETEDQDWTEFYPDATEELPPDMPIPKGKPIRITCFKDADHAHDLVTRRSVTGVLLFANNMPLEWLSKRQKTVETSTYGSELVAARIATDLIVEYRYKFRMLGVPVDGPALLLGDNASVIASTMIPSSPLRKKYNAIAYHRVREAIAANIIRLAKIDSKDNVSDCLTKPLGPEDFRRLIKRVLFRSPVHPHDSIHSRVTSQRVSQ